MSTSEGRIAERAVSRAGDVLLTVASIAGALCIAGAIAAAVFHLTLIMFSTGSMSPTIPTGAVALVREIPAAEVRIGDVVTVDRPGALPITHRVVSARPSTGDRTELVLRGDANAENDPAPYDVSHVRLVIASVPGGAQVISFFSNPLFLGSATLAATALVAWAFWPRGEQSPARREPEAAPVRHRSGVGHSGGAAGRALALLLAVGGGSTLLLASPAPARADESVSSSRYLTLTSVADPAQLAAVRPGVPVQWEVGVAAAPPAPAIIGLGLTSAGPLTGALDVSVRSCSARWTAAGCPGAAQTLVGTTSLSALLAGPSAAVGAAAPPTGVVTIGGMPSADQRWLALDVTLHSGSSTGSAALEVWAWMSGDDARASAPPMALARTGSGPVLLPLLLSGGAVVAGALIAGAAARRRRHPSRPASLEESP